MKTNDIFSLSLDTLKGFPDSICTEDNMVVIDNTVSPFITSLTDAWKNSPVIVDEIIAILCTEGKMNFRIAFNDCELNENTVCVIAPGTIAEVISVTSDFHCFMLAFTSDFVSIDQGKALELLQLFKYINRQPCVHLTGMYATRYKETFMETVKTAAWKENPLRSKMLQSYIYLLFCCLYPLIEKKEQIANNDSVVTRQKRIYYMFMEMLQANYRKYRTVAYYAECLGLTPKYLSKVVQSESGKSAMNWIDNYVILESRALLRQNNTSVGDVAVRMNFPDQSSFGKFFRRLTGMSPKEYKDKK